MAKRHFVRATAFTDRHSEQRSLSRAHSNSGKFICTILTLPSQNFPHAMFVCAFRQYFIIKFFFRQETLFSAHLTLSGQAY